MNCFGILRLSLDMMVTVLPVPVGPTHSTLFSLRSRSPNSCELRTLSMVGTSMSVIKYMGMKLILDMIMAVLPVQINSMFSCSEVEVGYLDGVGYCSENVCERCGTIESETEKAPSIKKFGWSALSSVGPPLLHHYARRSQTAGESETLRLPAICKKTLHRPPPIQPAQLTQQLWISGIVSINMNIAEKLLFWILYNLPTWVLHLQGNSVCLKTMHPVQPTRRSWLSSLCGHCEPSVVQPDQHKDRL